MLLIQLMRSNIELCNQSQQTVEEEVSMGTVTAAAADKEKCFVDEPKSQ